MTGEQRVGLVHQQRSREAELADTGGQLSNLFRGMLARISRIGVRGSRGQYSSCGNK
jgi:hypothetical protein